MYENFKYLDAVAQKEITNGVFSGSVLSVIHKGETVYLKSFGLADKEKNIPMKTDSIFRLFFYVKACHSRCRNDTYRAWPARHSSPAQVVYP